MKNGIDFNKLVYCPGVVGYYGADDITILLFSLLIARSAIQNNKRLRKDKYYSSLCHSFDRLIARNHRFMEDMQRLNPQLKG